MIYEYDFYYEEKKDKPWLVFILISILTFVFMISLIYPKIALEYFTLNPIYIFEKPYLLVTPIFGSANFNHYLLNSISLFFLGYVFEYRYGWKKFLILFLLSGIVGNIFFIIQYFGNPFVFGTGASGAISGILGALAVLSPREKIIMFPIIIPIDIKYAALLWFLFNFVGMLFPFLPIGFSAHLGGLIAGFIIGHILKKKEKVRYIEIEF